MTAPAHNLNGAQAFGIELLLTFVLIFTIFGATDPGKEHRGYEIPLSIGLCVFICHMVGVSVLNQTTTLFSTGSTYQGKHFLSDNTKGFIAGMDDLMCLYGLLKRRKD